jgi:hypothetical protein
MRWNSESDWIWSPQIVHTPLISVETYEQVRLVMATGQRPDRSPEAPRYATPVCAAELDLLWDLRPTDARHLEPRSRPLPVRCLH